ncbi:MAG: iron-containing redox enzyme family protein [Azospirillaceae bacterium]
MDPVRGFTLQIRGRAAIIAALLGQATEVMLRAPRPAEAWRDHMIMLYQVMRASVPMMEEAACRAEAGVEAIDPPLARYLRCHAAEERGHDAWALEDLAAAGVDPTEARMSLAMPAVAALVGAQHYWVRHAHPVAVLGYMAVLEGAAPTLPGIARLQAATGLPDACFRTLRAHATVDPGHVDALYALMDTLPLHAWHERLILASAWHTAARMADCVGVLRTERPMTVPSDASRPAVDRCDASAEVKKR